MVRGLECFSACSAAYGCLWPTYGQEEKDEEEDEEEEKKEEEEEVVVPSPQSFTLCLFGKLCP